jgi:hypothetical protein
MNRLTIAGEVALALTGAFALHAMGGGWTGLVVIATVAGAATVWTRIRALTPSRRRHG